MSYIRLEGSGFSLAIDRCTFPFWQIQLELGFVGKLVKEVIPAKAGIQEPPESGGNTGPWTPAFAGVTFPTKPNWGLPT